jgi:Cu(I)/Ag(I) efflux system membrane fusion protein
MDLQRIDDSSKPQAREAGQEKGKILYYRNPMNPSITSPVPAKDNMGMDYIPVYADESEGGEGSNVPGRVAFTLSPEREQLIGLTTTKAEIRDLNREVRASGQVAFDPDLFTAIEEYRQAVEALSLMGTDAPKTMKGQSGALVESSKTRLRLLGLSLRQIRSLADKRVDPMSLILPKGSVWIYAEVYEYETPGLKIGAPIQVEASAFPGKEFTGKLTSISPVLNAQTRTVRMRALVPDPQGMLRPDTYVNVIIKEALGRKLVVPADSVLHSGDKDYVFVVKEEGRLIPRLVRVGTKTNEWNEILSGLTEGETVATAANFLIDSESRIRAAASPAGGKIQSPSTSGKASGP